jgi:hypothetical protein
MSNINTVANITSSNTSSSPLQIGQGANPKVAVDSGGYSHVIWNNNGDVFYSDNTSGLWSTPVNLAYAASYSIAVDQDNNIHVVYAIYNQNVGEDSYIMYCNVSPILGCLDPITVAVGYSLFDPSIAIDSLGGLHLAYVDGFNTSSGRVFYRYRNISGVWDPTEQVTLESEKNWNEYTSIAVDSMLQPIIAWTGNPQQIAYRSSSGSWSSAEGISDPNVGLLNNVPSLVVGSDDTVYSFGGGADVCEKPHNGSWTCTKIPGSPDYFYTVLNQPSLAIDNQGQLYAVWGGVTLAIRTADRVWQQPVTVATGANPSLAVDANQHVHIVYECQSGDICYITTNWTISGNILDANGNAISGVNVSDGAGHTTTTDSNGNYTLKNLSAGSYSISATMSGHNFWPPSITVPLSSSNITGQNFSEWIDAVNAPLYLQTDPAWNKPNQFYDGTANTIYNLGCALSSDAMVLSYYGQFYSPPFQTDPGALNTALINFTNGYNQEGGVEPISFQSYAWSNGVLLSVTSVGQDNSADRQKLDQYLGSGNLAIFQVASPFSPSGVHFVVVTGKTVINGQSTYTLNDPYYGYTTLERYNNQFQYVFYYFTALTSSTYHRSLEISAHSPVQLVVADALGYRVGYDPSTDETYNEIPDAGYVTGAIAGPDGSTLPEEKYVLIPQPTNGAYSVQVIGDGSGSYTVDALQTDASGNTSLAQETGTAQPDSVDTYTVIIPYYLYLPLIIR